jgi:Luciferase-like monooxygenase
MRFSINIPNFGDFADATVVARVAAEAEAAGWDGLFVWDHVVHHKNNGRSFGDPWMLLTAAALATEQIKLGTLVTPIARRRPQQLARQVATLDNLTGGRVILGAGLGGPIEDEYGAFGEPTDPKLLAERLGRGVLAASPADATRRPLDGAVPLFLSAKHGHIPPVDEVRDLVAYVGAQRDSDSNRPFEIVLGGATPSDDAEARDVLWPLVEAGATWWDERQIQNERITELDPVLRRIDAGPPAF